METFMADFSLDDLQRSNSKSSEKRRTSSSASIVITSSKQYCPAMLWHLYPATTRRRKRRWSRSLKGTG